VYVAFDTETSGLPTSRARKVTLKNLSTWDSCRLLSIALVVYNDDHTENSSFHAVVKPDGFEVGATEIHGITKEFAEAEGVPFMAVYNIFTQVFRLCHNTIGHNVQFDINVLKSECLRRNLDMTVFDYMNVQCTLKMARNMFLEPVNKLGVLYKKFFGEDLEGAHDALIDTRACARLYAFIMSDPRKKSTIKATTVNIKASDIAACIGINNYKKPHEAMCDYWKRYAPETFTGKTELDIQKEALEKSERSQSILAKAIATIPKNSEETQAVYKEAKAAIDSDESLSAKDKASISDHIRKEVYTSHGTRSEDKTADLDHEKLLADDTFYEYPLITLGTTKYRILGRIDRYYMDDDGKKVLVEIKNRTRGLFKRVRDYEGAQVQAYLAMTGMSRGRLVEQFNDECMSHDVPVDSEWWSEICTSLNEFCRTLHHNMCEK
jgi:DNA polymerase III epsilon subunit-like protein